MTIKDVLMDKREQIQHTGNPCLVQFTADEINVLSDMTGLRCLKLQEPFPPDYVPTKDPFACVRAILEGDSLYRVLEFCLLKNRALRDYVPAVFETWR